MNLTAFLCHTWFEDHSWQPVPDLPRPLASLWSHPGLNSIDKLIVVRNNLFAEYVPEFCKIWCSWSNWQPFLSTSGLSITLGRLSPTYPVPWPVFGAILVRSVLKNTTNAWRIKLYNFLNTIWIVALLNGLGLHSWPKFVWGSPLAGCSRLTTSPGQPLESSWTDWWRETCTGWKQIWCKVHMSIWFELVHWWQISLQFWHG